MNPVPPPDAGTSGAPAISKRLKVVDALRQAITSGELKPGDRLIEREICEWTQASRPSVREAILQLKMEGFIRSTPNYGSVVATLTAEEAVNIYQMRGVLEGLAAKSFIELAHPEERRALRSALDNLHKQIEIGSIEGQMKYMAAFYDGLMAGCGNETLTKTLQVLHSRVMRLRAIYVTAPGRVQQSQREMLAILEAIEANDEQAAWDACIRHMERTAAVAMKVVGRLNKQET